MNATILNRDFQHPADGWYMVEPKGEHWNPAAGVIQIIDQEAAAAIVKRFNRDADAAGPRFCGMLVDHEHFSHDLDKETRAFGWLTRLAHRADGIYGQIRWTATGKAAVDGGDYRFFSTEYARKDAEVLTATDNLSRDGGGESLVTPTRIRPLALAGLTLTNKPNNQGGKPITNRQATGNTESTERTAESHDAPASGVRETRPSESSVFAAAKSDFVDAPGGASATVTKTITQNRMQTIAAKLGLAAEASENAILAEVINIMNRAAEAEAKVVPLQEQVTALTSENQSLKATQIETDLDFYQNRFAPEQRDAFRTLLVANRERTLEVLKSLKEPLAAERWPAAECAIAPRPKLRRSRARLRGLTPCVRAVEEFRIRNRCSFQEAWDAVRREKPGLFKQP